MSASISFWIFCVEINNAYSDEKIGFNQAADKESDQEFHHLANCWIYQLYEIQAADQAVDQVADKTAHQAAHQAAYQAVDQTADSKLMSCLEFFFKASQNLIRDWWQEYNKKNSKKSTMTYTSCFRNNFVFQFHSVWFRLYLLVGRNRMLYWKQYVSLYDY